MNLTRSLSALALTVCAHLFITPHARSEEDHDHHHEAAEGIREPRGFSLAEGWLDPWKHADFSRRGTPFVHMFNLEPAFLDRDLFIDYVATKSVDDERERELAFELEYAFTRR